MIEKIILIGVGGHAKVVYDTLFCLKKTHLVEVLDHNISLVGQSFFDKKVMLAKDEALLKLQGKIHAAMGDNQSRKRIYDKLLPNLNLLFSIIHPHALISSFSKIGEGVFIAAGAIIAANCHIGDGSIINHSVIVDHDCQVGSMVHIAPNATLSGGVSIGEGSLIGAGAVILPNVKVGKWATVAAGAVVTKDVLPGSQVMGVPAVSKEDIAHDYLK